MSAGRLAIASLPLAAIAALRRGAPVGAGQTRRLVVAGFLLAVHFATWIASLRHASVAVATLLVCTTPLWTEAWTIATTRRARPLVVASVVLGIAGVAVVAGAPSHHETPLGIGLALAGAVAIAGYLLLVGGVARSVDTLAVVSRTYPVAAVVLVAAALVVRDPLPSFADPAGWGGIAAMALVSQLLGHTALNAALRVFGATFVGTVTLIEPVVAGLLAALIFGERLAPATFGGGAIVLVAIALAVRAQPGTPPIAD